MSRISDQDHEHWRQHGYVIVPLLTEEEEAAALADINEYMPTWEEYVQRPRWFDHSVASPVRGPGQGAEYPYIGSALNRSTIHPDFVAFAERVMGTDRIMLSHGQLGGKYAGTRDFEQQLHRDYGNNTVVVPPPDEAIIAVPMIVYYTDVTVDLSPTYVVSAEHTRDFPLTPRSLSREDYPQVYEQEVPVAVPAGSAVIYSMNTFHRGSALRATQGLRFAQNIGLKRLDAPWAGQTTFQRLGGTPEMDQFLVHASPRERELCRVLRRRRPVLGRLHPRRCRGAVPRHGPDPLLQPTLARHVTGVRRVGRAAQREINAEPESSASSPTHRRSPSQLTSTTAGKCTAPRDPDRQPYHSQWCADE